jgi:hypothetical protein
MAVSALRIAVPFALLAAAAAPAGAADPQVTLKDGRVTIQADNVPVRKILEDWARVGQIRIVNLDRLVGPPVTLKLDSVLEKDALEVLLRGAAGYVAAPRIGDVAGASRFDRILILATSRAPAASPAMASGGQAPQPIVPQPADDDPAEPEEGEELQPPPPGMMQPGMPRPQGPLQLPQDPATFQGTADAGAQPGQPQQPLMLPRPGVVPVPQTSQPGSYPTTTPSPTQAVPGPTSAVPSTGTAQKPPPKKPGGESP